MKMDVSGMLQKKRNMSKIFQRKRKVFVFTTGALAILSIAFGLSTVHDRLKTCDMNPAMVNKMAGIEERPRPVICFVTSVFGTDSKGVDLPLDVRNYYPKEGNLTDFILFTNLDDLPAPGWKKIIKNNLPYRRFITQSRWGKFVGWRDPGMSHCEVVVYFDGYIMPKNNKGLSPFRKLAYQLFDSEVGLAQVKHTWDGFGFDKCFELIVETQKDVPENVKASLDWLHKQPDFDNNSTYYLNKWFGKFFSDRSIYISETLCP